MESLFSAFGIEWQLLLAQGVNFLILLVGLSYFLYKPVMKMLKERQEFIAKGVKDAEDAMVEKSKIEGERSGIILKAEGEAGGIVNRAEEEGKAKRSEIIESAKGRAESMLSDARLQAEELERQALLKSEKEIAKAAILAAEKILKGS